MTEALKVITGCALAEGGSWGKHGLPHEPRPEAQA